jgi:hypothetical protein
MPLHGIVEDGRVSSTIGGHAPNWVTQVHGSSSSGRQGEAEGEQEEDEAHRISVVTGLVEAQVIHQTVMISIGSRGWPQEPLMPWTTMPLTLPTPSLVAPPPLALPSTEVDTSVSGTPSNLLSLCGNRVLHWFARFATPIGKGRTPGSWDSMAELCHLAAVVEEEERCRGGRASGYDSMLEEVTKVKQVEE